MTKVKAIVCCVFLLVFFAVTAHATPFNAITNQIGYSGTVTYTPVGGTEQIVDTSIPRNGYIYIRNEAGITDYMIFMSDWSGHPPSNVNDSFFQLYDIGADSVTSATGEWDSSLSDFSVNMTGVNAVYTEDSDDPSNAWSRAWMPDQNTAARGTWTDYELTLTASGMNAANDSQWFVNQNDPSSIYGTFKGTFVSEARDYTWGSTVENTYVVDLVLSSDTFDASNFNGDAVNYFSAPVPEPATMFLFGVGLLGIAGVSRRKMA